MSRIQIFNPNLRKNKSYYMNFKLFIQVIKAYNFIMYKVHVV